MADTPRPSHQIEALRRASAKAGSRQEIPNDVTQNDFIVRPLLTDETYGLLEKYWKTVPDEDFNTTSLKQLLTKLNAKAPEEAQPEDDKGFGYISRAPAADAVEADASQADDTLGAAKDELLRATSAISSTESEINDFIDLGRDLGQTPDGGSLLQLDKLLLKGNFNPTLQSDGEGGIGPHRTFAYALEDKDGETIGGIVFTVFAGKDDQEPSVQTYTFVKPPYNHSNLDLERLLLKAQDEGVVNFVSEKRLGYFDNVRRGYKSFMTLDHLDGMSPESFANLWERLSINPYLWQRDIALLGFTPIAEMTTSGVTGPRQIAVTRREVVDHEGNALTVGMDIPQSQISKAEILWHLGLYRSARMGANYTSPPTSTETFDLPVFAEVEIECYDKARKVDALVSDGGDPTITGNTMNELLSGGAPEESIEAKRARLLADHSYCGNEVHFQDQEFQQRILPLIIHEPLLKEIDHSKNDMKIHLKSGGEPITTNKDSTRYPDLASATIHTLVFGVLKESGAPDTRQKIHIGGTNEEFKIKAVAVALVLGMPVADNNIVKFDEAGAPQITEVNERKLMEFLNTTPAGSTSSNRELILAAAQQALAGVTATPGARSTARAAPAPAA